MGSRLLNITGLGPDFLRMALTAASLNIWGTETDLKGDLMISVMSEEIARRQCLTRLDGIGSRTQVELLIPAITLDSSIGDTLDMLNSWCVSKIYNYFL